MFEEREYHLAILQGVVVGQVTLNEDGEIPSASFMLATNDVLLNEETTQIHNVTVVGAEMSKKVSLFNAGQKLRVKAKLIWHDDDYNGGERNAELIAHNIRPYVRGGEPFKYYQSIMLAGVLLENAEFSANMHGGNTRFAINTSDNFIGESLLQQHSFVAVNKTALICKSIKKGQFVRVIGKLLWLDGKSDATSFDGDRACEIVVMEVDTADKSIDVPFEPAGNAVENISDLLQLIEKKAVLMPLWQNNPVNTVGSDCYINY